MFFLPGKILSYSLFKPKRFISIKPLKQSLITTSLKRLRESNAHTKILDTKQRFQSLTERLKGFEGIVHSDDNNNVYNRRTVKEITEYFENISKMKPDIRSERYAFREADSLQILQPINKKNLPYKTIIEGSSLNFARKSNSLCCHINLNSTWNGKSVYVKKFNSLQYRRNSKSSFNVRESIRASLVAGILMLQYILWSVVKKILCSVATCSWF